MHNFLIKFSALIFVIIFSHTISAGTVIIANKANPDSGISKKLAKKIFLGKKSNTGSMEIVPIDQGENSEIRKTFYKKVANKSPEKMKSYWSKLIFSGRAVPLKVINGDAEVIFWISENKNAIGYVDSKSVTDSVKVLLELP